ncbi:Par32p ASCRUDRAFT_78724 [Ascoidea rubescens DSM 1968]|uniref:Uncharacterized protein n=1 Tax=Ascoidea rubescens DSM 1968 TaxID=1344418 RepID=A0A1D2VPY6_9ASCO|nr:hypothetical protein ASCRUDRAFT_78724 [Ascoidea rubescens DSM 1968]ODV63671.1 hypothetical protein ASCRUDRAFT_78724 [Ascoidea rubescens DSM 1968]
MTEEEVTYASFGRGGYSNFYKTVKSPTLENPKTIEKKDKVISPLESQPFFSSGRGGYGNMIANDDHEKLKIASDYKEDPNAAAVPPPKEEEPAFWKSTGRGGWGNMIEKKTPLSKVRSNISEKIE